MSNSVPLPRPFALAFSILLLNACGGGSGGSTSSSLPSQDASDAMNAGLNGVVDLSANHVTLEWRDTFARASRYEVEQQDASGAWVAIDGVMALHDPQGTTLRWTGPINGPATLRVEALLPDHSVPLLVFGQAPSTSLTSTLPAQIPSIVLHQPEPIESPVDASLANAAGILPDSGAPLSVTYELDSVALSGSAVAPDYLATLRVGGVTTGTHVISARVNEPVGFLNLLISRNVRIHSSDAAISVSGLLSSHVFDIYAVATSDAGISSAIAVMDWPAGLTQTLTTPDACVPPPCGAGQPFNAYHFTFDTRGLGQGFHDVAVEATDNAGSTNQEFTNFRLPAPPSATLDSPVDGTTVVGTLHVAGAFSSPVPGALELMVTLSGVPVYDTTVANTGAAISYSADVSLAGVTQGSHTLAVYARVGNTVYTAGPTAVVQVAASH
ncbi:MAG TPA: hypothetical protein VI653_04970 [Steroidobacteraceae bacterium]